MPDFDVRAGPIGKWQTKSDSMEDGITADLKYSTLTAKWDITDNLNFEAILSDWEQFQRQVIDFDGTEFLITTDDIPQERENQTIELHLSGTALERPHQLARRLLLARGGPDAALLSLGHVGVRRCRRTSTVNPATGFARGSARNMAYCEYVRQTAAAEPERLLGRQHASRGRGRTTGQAAPTSAIRGSHERQRRRADQRLGRRRGVGSAR